MTRPPKKFKNKIFLKFGIMFFIFNLFLSFANHTWAGLLEDHELRKTITETRQKFNQIAKLKVNGISDLGRGGISPFNFVSYPDKFLGFTLRPDGILDCEARVVLDNLIYDINKFFDLAEKENPQGKCFGYNFSDNEARSEILRLRVAFRKLSSNSSNHKSVSSTEWSTALHELKIEY